jgi:hypothetical protein
MGGDNPNRMLKKPASVRRPLFGLFGLSSLSGFWLSETNQINQINKTNQMNQTDRVWAAHADPQSSNVPT